MLLKSINPATSEVVAKFECLNTQELNTIVEDAHEAFLHWRNVKIDVRCEMLASVAKVLHFRQDELAALITAEMGKPISQAKAEIQKCAKVCEYYAARAPEFLADEVLHSQEGNCRAHFAPLGVIMAVMPWNFPFWQVFRFAAPTLAAGNTCLLKHASNVSGCALAIERVFREAGVIENGFRTLLLEADRVEQVIRHPNVRAVTLTGSTHAGRAVATAASGVLKKTVLELGGSDPYIVLKDANIQKAAKLCAESRMINAGQSCISAKRFIVDKIIAEEFTSAFTVYMAGYHPGDPTDPSTQLGPLAHDDFRRVLHDQVLATIKQGAKLLCGGTLMDGPGAYYQATVLDQVPVKSPGFCEELFGPVASIIHADNEEDAIALANNSQFGLGSAIFSNDIERAAQIARRIEAGCCFINDFVRSAPELPFGGIKDSGYGRELSHYGIKEFVNIQTIVVSQ